MDNINDNYFDGVYKEIWRNIIPEILTKRETDFMVSYFSLRPGMRVLDLMCGYGRHAISLARKGIEVTAVDNLDSYIEEINEVATRESLPITTQVENVQSFIPGENKYDLVICMGNSLNFYDAKDTKQLLSNVFKGLKASGNILINTWSLAEIVLPQFKENSEAVINEVNCNTRSKLLEDPLRMESVTKFTKKDGSTEVKMAIDYLHSWKEMKTMLVETGFNSIDIYSIPGKKKFTEGEPRAYIIAKRS